MYGMFTTDVSVFCLKLCSGDVNFSIACVFHTSYGVYGIIQTSLDNFGGDIRCLFFIAILSTLDFEVHPQEVITYANTGLISSKCSLFFFLDINACLSIFF